MKILSLLFLAFTSFSCNIFQKSASIDVNSVELNAGKVSGKTTNDRAVKIFMGVPFAAPPEGELRWKAPQPVVPWKGTKACFTPPASAMQPTPKPFYCWSKEFMAPESPLSEDCLYLNIWTTAKKAGDKLPVMVWIHGGGFTGGSGTVPLYDGEAMSRKKVVFVTINYRLGIFGFLAHPELSAESNLKTSGNYGILDQIAALKWIKENISAFGGNPDNVTIAGQSAGAFSVNILMVSPLAKGLFNKAIAESGGMFSRLSPGQTLKDAEEDGKQVFKNLNLNSIAELRALPADSLLKTEGRFSPAIDDVVIPPILTSFETGNYNDVPLISGWNADDGVSFGTPAKAAQFRENSARRYGEKTESFLKLFPANSDEEAAHSQKLMNQLFFGWNNYAWAKLHSEKGRGKSYLYYFKRVPPGEPDYGAFHSAEIGYALHNLYQWNRPFIKTDYKVEEMMSSYWVYFAQKGNPNRDILPIWPAYDVNNPRVIQFGDNIKSVPLPYREQLQFLDEINN